MKKLLIAAAALLATTGLARADVTLGGQTWNTSSATTITLSNIVPPGNQVKNLPCIICGDNQPLQPSNFGYNDFGNTGNQTDLKFFSSGTIDDKTLGSDTLSATNYSAGFLINFLQAAGDANLTDEQIAILPFEMYRQGYEYYWKTHAHPNSTFKYTMSSLLDLMRWDATDQIELIDQPLLMIAGSKADSLYMTEDAFPRATGTKDKELFKIEGATHIETYWVPKYVDAAMGKLTPFFARTLVSDRS
jgi:pimeloyl-ACP methyl ester carboxylesterase